MTRPEAVRRVKSYSAATGYVYQYYFYEVQKTRRGLTPGTEYVYMVSADRKRAFPLRSSSAGTRRRNGDGRLGAPFQGLRSTRSPRCVCSSPG